MGHKINSEIGLNLQEKALLVALAADIAVGFNAESSQSLSSAGLVIHGAGGTVPKTGASAWYGAAGGVLVTKGAATDMAALAGTVVNGQYNVFCHYCDAAGTLTTVMGTAGASLAAIVFPPTPTAKALLGFTIVHPTGTGNFVGGTTALDDATVVPNAVYISVQGSVDLVSTPSVTA